MKYLIFILLSLFVMLPNTSDAKSKGKNIPIKDMRGQKKYDFSKNPKGMKAGQLIVERINEPRDVTVSPANAYHFLFFSSLDGKLEPRSMVVESNKDFDKARYVWQDDGFLAVTLTNSKTKETASVKLGDPKCKGCSAAVPEDGLKGF